MMRSIYAGQESAIKYLQDLIQKIEQGQFECQIYELSSELHEATCPHSLRSPTLTAIMQITDATKYLPDYFQWVRKAKR